MYIFLRMIGKRNMLKYCNKYVPCLHVTTDHTWRRVYLRDKDALFKMKHALVYRKTHIISWKLLNLFYGIELRLFLSMGDSDTAIAAKWACCVVLWHCTNECKKGICVQLIKVYITSWSTEPTFKTVLTLFWISVTGGFQDKPWNINDSLFNSLYCLTDCT